MTNIRFIYLIASIVEIIILTLSETSLDIFRFALWPGTNIDNYFDESAKFVYISLIFSIPNILGIRGLVSMEYTELFDIIYIPDFDFYNRH